MRAVSLFDTSGVMLKPWAEAGYECFLYDIQHPEGYSMREDGMHCLGTDLSNTDWLGRWGTFQSTEKRFLPEGEVSFLSCFPPCTHLAVSGARWFQGKGLRALEESIAYFATCIEISEVLGCPYLIENPMSTISTYWREPDYKFHPCHYSGYVNGEENYTKETWLWTGNGFVMPPRDMGPDLFNEPDKTYIHHQPPGEERANIRSKTPEGFAKAVYEANHRNSMRTQNNG